MKSFNFLIILFSSITIFSLSCSKDDLSDSTAVLLYESQTSRINEWCSSLYFISKQTGYSTTQAGKIYKTADGGQNWTLYNTETALPLNGAFFINENTGYIFGGKSGCSPTPCTVPGSIMLKTSNEGKTWERLTLPYSWSELNSAYFFDENSGLVVGLGLCIRTTNGGKTWESLTIGRNNISKIIFKDNEVGYAQDLMGGLFRTDDAGQSWKTIIINESKSTTDFCFVDESTGFAINNNHLYKTSDQGRSWELIKTSEDEVGYTYFVTEKTGIVFGKKYSNSGILDFASTYKYVVQVTNDGGKKWLTKEFAQDEFNDRCLFYKDNTIYSLAYNKIFKLTFE
jgi:photosystem II stability/assembly factor-like uncharacterized protein